MSGGQAGGPSSGTSTPSRGSGSQPASLLSANLAAHLSKPIVSSASAAASNVTVESTPHPHPHHTASPAAPNGMRIPIHSTGAHAGKAPPVAADSAELAIVNHDVWKSSAARRAEKAWAVQSEKTLQTDGRFKKHTSAVEKCLATFESVSEWADFIAFLGRLLKTLQSAPHFNAVPRKLIVAKRLSQCLNPALPSGVHQRALEVYEHIFTILGPEGLRRDLSVWSPGLLPFFQFASMTVKPIVLNIIELYYLPLGQDLRPIAKPLQLALLPGLEEETSEHFDRVLKLLDKIQDSIGQPYFLQNLWLILISVPAVRLPDLHYLARRLPDLNNDPTASGEGGTKSGDVTSIVGPDIGLTIRAFSAALGDDSLLVQRAMLDILVVKFRMDSTTFKTLVRNDDRVSLVQSALGIVLRRDISLNRRLYTWLLGPSEDVDAQQKYFEQHAMAWARLALLTDFNAEQPSRSDDALGSKGTADRQRPYRILISLLDKWSLGLPMTNALIVDTFIALKRQLEASGSEDGSAASSSDVSTTAKMLFEAVDPFALYRQFYYAVCKELQNDDKDAKPASSPSIIDLLRFIMSSFRVHDEESRVVHLPTLFVALIELTLQRPNEERSIATLQLARDILSLIPKRVFSHRRDDVAVKTTSFVQHGERLYEITSSGADEAAKRYVGFQHPNTIAELLDMCANLPLRNPALSVEALTILCQLLNILDATLDGDAIQAKVAWQGARWIDQMKPFFRSAKSFIELEACIEAFVAASQCRALRDTITLDDTGVAEEIVAKLLRNMRPSAGPYHVRSVELLWTVADLAPKTPIGDVLSWRISATTAQERQDAFDTFGVLWKYSGEARLADALLINPLLSILDGLRSTSWLEVQMAERWVRHQAHTYTALLDPLLLMVCDPTCLRTPITHSIEGQNIAFLQYRRPLDHEKVSYALSVLHQVVQTGGPSMARTLRTSHVHRSNHAVLASQAPKQDITYAQFITDRLQELLQSNPPRNSPYQAAYQSVLALAVDLLNAVLQKVHPSEQKLQELETVLLQRLLVDVDTEVLTVQGKTLQTLHAIMNLRAAAASANNAAAVAAASSSTRSRTVGTAGQSPSPPRLLLPAIKAGLSMRSNRPVLQQWTDFVSAITPVYRHALSPLLLPLNQGVCALVRSAIGHLEGAYSVQGAQQDATCETSETDVVMLLAMSERILLQSLEQQGQASGADGASTATTSGGSSSGGEKAELFSFMGALSNVFSTEPAAEHSAGGQGSNAVWKSLHQTVMTLHLAWLSSGERTIVVDDSRLDTLEVVRQSIRARSKRYLERLYRQHSGEVVEALVACWHLAVNETDKKRSEDGAQTAFEILSFLAPSAQIVVTFLCDVIATRISSPSSMGAGEKNAGGAGNGAGKHMSSPGVPDVVLQAFLEAYLARLDATATAQVWPVVTIFVKDIVSNSAQRKAQIYPTLRCLTVIGEKVMDESNTTDDRRLKRDLVEHYVRICDLSILIAGRSFEQTTWIGRRTVTSEQEEEGAGGGNEKQMSASVGDLSSATTTTSIDLIQTYLTERVLPALRAFALDTDKLASLSTNMVYYIIAPALRPKRRAADVHPTVVSLLLELTKTPGTFKTWRTTVAEFFSDARFFDMDVVAGGERWTSIVLALMTHDRERFVETIGRVSTPSTNIFTNREAETRMRTMNIRRMSYVLFAAPKDYWLTQLPLIQEKLVDVLRNAGTAAIDPAVGEVYLCLRVLLLRFASRHLSGFWPVVITEMTRLFEGCVDELPADNSDALALVEAASRFLDLLVTLQTDEFQVHQWLFITDTVDIVYPPDDWAPEAILDRLAIVIGERRAARNTARSSSPAVGATRSRQSRVQVGTKTRGQSESSVTNKTTALRRRPLLWQDGESAAHGEQPLSRIEDLQPFFANISLHAFESTYASGDAVDWDVIETMLKHALFSGASGAGEEEAL